ncbi:MAG TPA: hypothetical protein GX400_21845 [Chloroflexi bacterium]|nr:hypothetical protein [Chloroflexota bacterium]
MNHLSISIEKHQAHVARPPLEFWGSVTGIGSLPHVDPTAAVDFVAQQCPDIPFWPQLTQRAPEEYMLLQMLTPLLDLLHRQSPARLLVKPGQLADFRKRLQQVEATFTAATAAGFFAFERACAAGRFTNARILKGQISGPLTLGRCLLTEEGAPGRNSPQPTWHTLLNDPAVMNELTDYLCRLATWQIQRLQRFGKPVMLFVDEPALTPALSTPTQLVYLRRVLETIRNAGAIAGVHCCALGATEALLATAPDVISFDAYSELETFMSTPTLPAFFAAGGGLAPGLIPTFNDPTSLAADDLFLRWSQSLTLAGLDAGVVARRTLITATCGLGLLPLSAAQASFTQAQRLGFLVYMQAELADVPA